MILGSISENSPFEGHDNERSEAGVASDGQQVNTNTLVDDFSFQLNSNSREKSEITKETVRIINEELSSQISRKRLTL